MLDIQRIRDNPEVVKQSSANKNDPADVDGILELDRRRRELIKDVEQLKSERNSSSMQISRLKKEGKDAGDIISNMKQVSDTIKEKDERLVRLEEDIQRLMVRVPNVVHSSVKHGTVVDNEVLSVHGEERTFDFELKDHLQIGTALDIIDFPRGAKVTGAGFPVLKGAGALLDRAIINFMLDRHTRLNGYTEIFPPFLVNRDSAFGTGQLPKSEDQMYHAGEDDLFCIPTAEVPVTNLHREEVLEAAQLPVKYCAYSACFRREAGSYGKDTKGFLRVHQFNKVELVKFADPDTSYEQLESLTRDAEGVLEALGLRYRRLGLCDGDLSFASAKTYDLEIWAPAEKKWLEVSSCSNFEDFQSRRMNIRFRPAGGGKPRFVHTLNGSGVATARLIVAILETYQTLCGSVTVPAALRPYMNGLAEIPGK
jgi:seryl-tRNA synthetase